MHISSVHLIGFRNYKDSEIKFEPKTLMIGANDVGKTNLLYAVRLLLDRSFSEVDLEPSEQDFYIDANGKSVDALSITIHFADVTQDAVLSILAGFVSDDGKLTLRYAAVKGDTNFKIYAGREIGSLDEIQSRYYLKHLSLRLVNSQRDLSKYIKVEKKHLLRIAQKNRTEAEVAEDAVIMNRVSASLLGINRRIRKLKYVVSATNEVNSELKTMAYHHQDYAVQLESGAIQIGEFVEKLELAGSTNGASVMLGGDGRNNQILLALWKAKSVQEHDLEHESVIYCVEEPEAHLHPHQQRKLAAYLSEEIPGQSIVTTHSAAVVASYSPESVVRLVASANGTFAASGGCAKGIVDGWNGMGYRMSVLPAEAFFSAAVFLVEGPSEKLFYTLLADKLGIDLDFYNISILSVDGVAFEIYARILNAMEIPFVLRTDNDVSDITWGKQGEKVNGRNLAGINRCLSIAGIPKLLHVCGPYVSTDTLSDGAWNLASGKVNPKGIYLSRVDLEHDLADEFPAEMASFYGPTAAAAVAYLQAKKAVRMREFLLAHGDAFVGKENGLLAAPLLHCVEFAKGAA